MTAVLVLLYQCEVVKPQPWEAPAAILTMHQIPWCLDLGFPSLWNQGREVGRWGKEVKVVKEYELPVVRRLTSRDLMYSMMMVGNNIVYILENC